jgi:hypothetical protein
MRDIWPDRRGLNANEMDVGKKQSNPITGLDRPRWFQEVEALKFQDNRHMKVLRSALPTGHLYPAGYIPVTRFY